MYLARPRQGQVVPECSEELLVEPPAPDMVEEVSTKHDVKRPAHVLRERRAPRVPDNTRCRHRRRRRRLEVPSEVRADRRNVQLKVAEHHLAPGTCERDASEARAA